MGEKDKSYVLRENIVFREEDDGAFLFDPDTDALHCTNKVGASICKLCDKENTIDNICNDLPNEYQIDIDPEQLEKDVKSFLKELVDLEFIQEK